MHPQNMQISNMLHLPHVTAINGQVKVSSLTTQEEHKKPEDRGKNSKEKGGRSSTSSDLQGCLLSILAHYPTTADSA